MKGRGGRRAGQVPHPHHRLVHSVEARDEVADEIRDEDIPEVIEQVMRNLVRDAHTITDGAMVAISGEFTRYALALDLDDAAVVRDAVFEIVAGAFKKRLLAALSDQSELQQ
jgi:hypothetical protein